MAQQKKQSTGLALPTWSASPVAPTTDASKTGTQASTSSAPAVPSPAPLPAPTTTPAPNTTSTPAPQLPAGYTYQQSYYANPATAAAYYHPAYQQALAATIAAQSTPGAAAANQAALAAYYTQYAAQYGHQHPYAITAATGQPYGAQPLTVSTATTTIPSQKTATTTPTSWAAPVHSTANVSSTAITATSVPLPPPKPALDTANVAQLNDALGSAGVDLRAEEEAIQQHARPLTSNLHLNREDRAKKQNFVDQTLFREKVQVIVSNHTLKISDNALSYVALALQSRLSTLVESCVSACDHRTQSHYTRPPPFYPRDPNLPNDASAELVPMWSQLVRRDLAKQLAALEKIDREEELRARRRRRERNENEADGMGGGMGGGGDEDEDGDEDMDGEPKKKKRKKKETMGPASKNLTDDVRKKMSDAVASQAGGAKQYSWMMGGGAGAGAPKKPAAPAATPKPATATPTSTPANPATTGNTTSGGFVRPFVSNRAVTSTTTATVPQPEERTLTVADLLFVIGRERGHGAGRGAAKHWAGGY